MSWTLILILINRFSGATDGIATASFGSEAACQSAVTAMQEWSERARTTYPTDTPFIHAICVPVEARP